MFKRIAIVGAGAVGGYVGARFARTGLDVTLIDAWPEHVEARSTDEGRLRRQSGILPPLGTRLQPAAGELGLKRGSVAFADTSSNTTSTGSPTLRSRFCTPTTLPVSRTPSSSSTWTAL
jgi:glycine/D-amino acid oxidase-like deaminating enzyme